MNDLLLLDQPLPALVAARAAMQPQAWAVHAPGYSWRWRELAARDDVMTDRSASDYGPCGKLISDNRIAPQ
ncbi:MAG: hypothetical protein ABI433_00250 [Burkholderiaceae bacterium]